VQCREQHGSQSLRSAPMDLHPALFLSFFYSELEVLIPVSIAVDRGWHLGSETWWLSIVCSISVADIHHRKSGPLSVDSLEAAGMEKRLLDVPDADLLRTLKSALCNEYGVEGITE
jgi:hypothetical protein